MIDLSGRTAVIIGGMHALALGVAGRLSAAGAKVMLAHAADDAQAAAKLQNKLRAQYITAENYPLMLHTQAQMLNEMKALPAFDLAILVPRWFQFKPFLETSAGDWQSVLEQNFEQMLYAGQAVAKCWIEQAHGGRMIYLSSAAGAMPLSETSALGTTLAALRALAKMAAVDLAVYDITVNIVAVGPVEVEWMDEFLQGEGRAYIEAGIPLQRLATPEDVGNACLFLASALADYITGATLPVDGGYLLTRSEGRSPYPTWTTQGKDKL